MRRHARWLAPLLLATALIGGTLPADAAPARRTVDYAWRGVNAFGSAPKLGQPEWVAEPLTAMARTPSGKGYWLASADGGVFTFGDARFLGSAGGLPLQSPVIAMAGTPSGNGYWLLAADGGVFTFGDARFFGSTGGMRLNQPIVAMAATPSGHGYWLVAADGGVFTFGDARFLGSTGGIQLVSPVVGMAATPSGHGYWLVAGDGGIFTFGDAPFRGSAVNALPDGATGMARTSDGQGYWILGYDGSVVTKGTARSFGGTSSPLPQVPARGIVAMPDDGGYWIFAPDGVRTLFVGGPSRGGGPLGDELVAIAASQLGANPAASPYCNPYGACMSWCAIFLTWVWQQGGVGIPTYAFTGSVWNWAAARGRARPANGGANLGDAIFFGTGPQTVWTSVHVSMVAARWPDGTVITIDGNSGPGPEGRHNVVTRRPFNPANARATAGMPVYAIATP
jgi:hypothetical protein